MNNKILDFYKQQGERTNVENSIFDQFPKTIEGIVSVIQNVLIHEYRIKSQNIKSSLKNLEDWNPKDVNLIFSKINLKKITKKLDLDKKSVGICRNYSMLLASVLRENNIPSRTRCGFATYFGCGYFEDHWITEYWDSKKNKWIMVDAQMDEYWRKTLNLDPKVFNLFDIKKGQFFSGGEIWQLYRQSFIDDNICGFSPQGDVGEHYIRGNMLRDFFALNKIEYRYSEKSRLMKKDTVLSKKDLSILDKIAELSKSPDKNFNQLRKFYIKEKNNV